MNINAIFDHSSAPRWRTGPPHVRPSAFGVLGAAQNARAARASAESKIFTGSKPVVFDELKRGDAIWSNFCIDTTYGCSGGTGTLAAAYASPRACQFRASATPSTNPCF